MSQLWKNIGSIIIFIYLIVNLAINYHKYANCAKPIQDWYMGFLGLMVILQLALMIMNCVVQTNCIWVVCFVIIGPLNFLFILIWNIVGSVYMGFILASKNRSECIQTFEIVCDIVIQCVIYLVYFWVFFNLVKYFRTFRKKMQEKNKLKNTLNSIYVQISQTPMRMSNEKMVEARNEIRKMLKDHRAQVEKLNMLDSEASVIRRFFMPGAANSVGDPGPVKDNSQIIQVEGENRMSRLSQPLLEIMGRSGDNPDIERKISLIQERANPENEECIICFDDLNDESSKVVFKCDHKFHDACIFEWLKKNPTCPLCRHHFRIGLLQKIIKFLNDQLGDLGQIDEVHSQIDLLDVNIENA